MRLRAVVPGVVGSAFFAWFTVSGCSTTNVTQVTNCGAGTQLVNGTCVATANDAGGTGGADTGGGTSGDAGVDAEVLVDDPCPVEVLTDGGTKVYNCDPTCGTVHVDCEDLRCRKAGEPPGRLGIFPANHIRIGQPDLESFSKVIVRIPKNPWESMGECDRSRTSLNPTYTPMSPRPRWAFAIPFYKNTTEPRYLKNYAVSADRYRLRVLAEDPVGCQEGQRFEFCARFEPLPQEPDALAWSADKSSCISFVPHELHVRFPTTFSYGFAVLYTHADAMPARNVIINQAPGASCSGMP